MNSKTTWTLVMLAVGLFAFVYFFERHLPQNRDALKHARVLPQLNPREVTSIQIRREGQQEIRAERANNNWSLTKPIAYPAQSSAIDVLLETLQKLPGQNYIAAEELKNRPQADKEFGFESPQISLIFQQGNYRGQVLIGKRTALGDELFLQVVGIEGLYVVDADLLRFFPRQVNDWRSPVFANLKNIGFDRVLVASVAKIFELQREATSKLWRMTQPMKTRADNPKIEDLLQRLKNVSVAQFVSDDPKTDLESFGLQPPELELALAQGTNTLLRFQFGKSPTNDASKIFARRSDQDSVVLISRDGVEPWRAPHSEFRDRRLISADLAGVQLIEARGLENFSAQRQTNGLWRITGAENFIADFDLIREWTGNLSGLEVAQFTKDVATDLDFPAYGLAPASRQYLFKTATSVTGTNPVVSAATNAVLAQIDFGATNDNRVFVRRSDENSIYAVKLEDFKRLPAASWQLRERRIWNFSENDVSRVTSTQNGKARVLVRDGVNRWSLAAGSQGVINDFAIEETVHRLGELSAVSWAARGEQSRTQFDFSEKSLRISVELKQNGKPQTLTVEFGGVSPAQLVYAAVNLDGQLWIFECPQTISAAVAAYLAIPATP